jgi:hypothetical protein
MNRITIKHLEQLCDYLNKLTGNPVEKWHIGNFHISQAYGGVCLHRLVNPSGGISTPLIHGHVSKRELFELMHAFIKGLEFNAVQH